MRNNLKNILKLICGSVLVLYLAAGAVLVFWGNGHKAYLRSLARMSAMEWDNYPLRLARGQAAVDGPELRRAIRYYKTLLLAFPSLDQAYDVMGFCYFYLNDFRRSERSYQKASKLFPASFWHDYNLGVLYYREGSWDKALACFLRVLGVPMADVPRRGIYAPLAKMNPEEREKFLQQGQMFAVMVREKSLVMAMQTYLMMKKYDDARVLAGNALRDSLVTDKKTFLLYFVATSQGRQELLDAVLKESRFVQDKQPVMHPWVFGIPVGKEMYY